MTTRRPLSLPPFLGFVTLYISLLERTAGVGEGITALSFMTAHPAWKPRNEDRAGWFDRTPFAHLFSKSNANASEMF